MPEICDDSMQDLIIYLCSHEDDIKHGINDFGDLESIFFEVVGRKAGEEIKDTIGVW